MNQSDVRLLLQKIMLEYEAAQNALYAPSLGAARHSFITERLERMSTYHEELSSGIGHAEATRLMCEQLTVEASS